MLKRIQLPDYDDMFDRLRGIAALQTGYSWEHLFEPMLAWAGRTLDGTGIAMMLTEVFGEYIKGASALVPEIGSIIYGLAPDIVAALVDDEEVKLLVMEGIKHAHSTPKPSV